MFWRSIRRFLYRSAETSMVTSAPGRHFDRRWWQFSLRTLMVVVTVVAVVCGLFMIQYNAARRQASRVETLASKGAVICYDQQYEDGSYRKRGNSPPGRIPPPASNWLIEWLGVDFFHRVYGVSIHLKDDEPSAKQLRPVGQLENLIDLQIE